MSNIGSASSPQSVTIINNGNANLTFAAPSSGYNPSISADFTIQTSGGSTSACPILNASSGAAIFPAGTFCTDALTFSSNAAGTVSGKLVVSDDNLNAPAGTQIVSLTGAAATVTLAPTSLNSGQVDVSYTQTLAASGGSAPYAFAVTQGSLPAGLGLSSSGIISGTPSSAGAFSFTVTATSAETIVGSKMYSLTVAPPTVTLTPTRLPAAQVNLAYGQALTANDGTAPYSYQLTSGALPSGLTLSTTGLLSGTPTTTGTFTFTISATDSSTGAGAPFSASVSYTLGVNAPAITIAPGTLPPGQVGVTYTQVMFAASGGTSPYSYKVKTGSLPAGLTLSSAGLLSGMPTAGGSFIFIIVATDANNFTAGQSYSITLNAAAVKITPGTLATAQVNAAFGQAFSAGGGTAPYKFAVTGTLPAGIIFDAGTATFSGTPTVGGSFPISVSATDSSSGAGPYTSAVNYVLKVNPATAVLTFASIPPQTYGSPPFTVSANSASGGAITYSMVAGPAIINSTTGLTTLTGAGQVTIEASQAATSSYEGAAAQIVLNIARQQSVTTITGSLLSISLGQKITLTASVAPAVTGTPTGTVAFFDGGTQIGSPVILTNGTAALITSSFALGGNAISAVYSGDSNFHGSRSTLSSPIVVVSLGFSFLAPGSATAKVMPGGAATFNFKLDPNGGNYPGMVSFSVDGLPPGASYTVSPTSVPSTAGSQTITVTIRSSSGISASVAPPRSGRRHTPFLLALLLPFLGLRRLRIKSRNLSSALVLMVLLAAGALTIFPVSGCTAELSGILGQSYSVAVTATSGTEQHTAFVNMTVK